MSALGGFVTGVLGLSALEVVVSNSAAAGRLSGALLGVSAVIKHLADPAVPAIPDLRSGSATTASVYTGAGSSSVTGAQPTLNVVRNRFPTTVNT